MRFVISDWEDEGSFVRRLWSTQFLINSGIECLLVLSDDDARYARSLLPATRVAVAPLRAWPLAPGSMHLARQIDEFRPDVIVSYGQPDSQEADFYSSIFQGIPLQMEPWRQGDTDGARITRLMEKVRAVQVEPDNAHFPLDPEWEKAALRELDRSRISGRSFVALMEPKATIDRQFWSRVTRAFCDALRIDNVLLLSRDTVGASVAFDEHKEAVFSFPTNLHSVGATLGVLKFAAGFCGVLCPELYMAIGVNAPTLGIIPGEQAMRAAPLRSKPNALILQSDLSASEAENRIRSTFHSADQPGPAVSA